MIGLPVGVPPSAELPPPPPEPPEPLDSITPTDQPTATDESTATDSDSCIFTTYFFTSSSVPASFNDASWSSVWNGVGSTSQSWLRFFGGFDFDYVTSSTLTGSNTDCTVTSTSYVAFQNSHFITLPPSMMG